VAVRAENGRIAVRVTMNVVLVTNGPAATRERDPLARRHVPLLTRLVEQGVSLRVVLMGDAGGLRAPLTDAGLRVDVLPAPLPPGPAGVAGMPRAVAALGALLDGCDDADILEGDEPLPAIALGLAARRRSARLVYRRHHDGGRLRLRLASRMAARLADRTLVSCEAMRRRAAADDGVGLDRIDVAISGTSEIDVPPPCELARTRADLGIPATAPVIVAVSRLRQEKGVDVLIRSLDALRGTDAPHLVVVGDGPEEPALRRLAQDAAVPVHFVGHRLDVDCWLALAAVVAIPSRREAFGRVTLEAMAARRPVVASRVGGIVDAIADGETGLLVPPDDPAALGAALRAVLEEPALAGRLAAAARRRYERGHTMDHMAASWRLAWERTRQAQPVHA